MGVAIAVGVAVPVGSAAIADEVQSSNQANQIQEDISQFLSNEGFFDIEAPVNDMIIPVEGYDLPDYGCGDSSVRFQEGKCYPVLKRGPCRNPYYCIPVSPVNLTLEKYFQLLFFSTPL